MTKLGVLLMILCRERTLILLSLELKLLKVIEEMLEKRFTLAEDCKICQVTTNFETAVLSVVCCRILTDGVNGVPFSKDRDEFVLGLLEITLGNALL